MLFMSNLLLKYILLDPELNQGAISTGKKSIEPLEDRLGAAEWSKCWTGEGVGEGSNSCGFESRSGSSFDLSLRW